MAISLGVKIWGDIKPLLTELKKAEKSLQKFGRNTARIGEELSKSLTLPIVGFGVLAVKNFAEAEKASASLASQIRANGKDVDSTLKKYEAFAQEIQNVTTVEDDAVKGFIQLAESMQSINPEEAVRGAIGLNKAFGVEMPAAIKMAVQAQNGQFTMLSRLNPAIKAAKDESEKAAIAQKMFSDSFKVATTQAKVGLGPLEQLKNQIGNLTEEYGRLISEALLPIVEKIKSVATWLNSLSDSQRKWIVSIGLAVAAAGPLLLAIGKISSVISIVVGGFGKFIVVMRTVHLFLAANPWAVLAAAITAVGLAAFTAGRYLANMGSKDGIAEKRKKEADQAQKDINDYVSADKKGREQIISNLRKQAQSYVDLYNKAKEANDTKSMEHYSVQVAKLNVLVEDMKTSAKGYVQPKVESSGLKQHQGIVERLTEELKKLKERLLEEVAVNSKNASSTAELIARKEELLKFYQKEAEALTKLLTIPSRKPENLEVGMTVKENGNIADLLTKHNDAAQKLRGELVNLDNAQKKEIETGKTNYNVLNDIALQREKVTEKLKKEESAIASLINTAKENIIIPVEFKEDKIDTPKVDGVTVPVDYKEGKIVNPKTEGVTVPVDYKEGKIVNPKAEGINIPVDYQEGKVDIPKVDDVKVNVDFIEGKIDIPKVDGVEIPVSVQKPDLEGITIPVNYEDKDFATQDFENVTVPVDYQGELPMVKPDTVIVPVEYKGEYKPAEIPDATVDLSYNVKYPEIPPQEQLKNLISELSLLQDQYKKVTEEEGRVSESSIKLANSINETISKVQELKNSLQFKPVTIGIQSTMPTLPAPQKVPNSPTQPQTKRDTGIGDMISELEMFGETLDRISGDKLGNFFSAFKNAFSNIAIAIKEAAKNTKQGWNNAMQAVLQAASSVVSAITDIISTNNQQRIADNDAYYENERERIENSLMTQEQKTRALEKLDKNYEKKRKSLMREQAKDAKAAAIMQAIIQGALAVVTALGSMPPPMSFIMAAVVGALAAAQIALIAAQPLPALAEGGLAMAPTMAVVGDNPNARIDPEVISPLSKLKGMMKGTQEVVVYGTIKGSDILLSSEKGQLKLARVRGY